MWYFARFGTICKLKNVKNTHWGKLLLVKLQALTFLNCADGTKSCKASHFLCTSVHRCKMSWQIAFFIYMWFWIAYPYFIWREIFCLHLFPLSEGYCQSKMDMWNSSEMYLTWCILDQYWRVCRLWTYHNSGTRHKVCHNIKNRF